MIIKAPIKNGSIVTFRLATGESVIARLVDRDALSVTISKPVIAHAQQHEQGIGVSFHPFCVTANDDQQFKIPVAAMVFEPVTPHDELVATYTRATTGLELPS